MTKQEFIEKHKEDTKGYCPCVVDYEGNLYECPKGHLEALMELGRKKIYYWKYQIIFHHCFI